MLRQHAAAGGLFCWLSRCIAYLLSSPRQNAASLQPFLLKCFLISFNVCVSAQLPLDVRRSYSSQLNGRNRSCPIVPKAWVDYLLWRHSLVSLSSKKNIARPLTHASVRACDELCVWKIWMNKAEINSLVETAGYVGLLWRIVCVSGRVGEAAAAGQPHPGGLRQRKDRQERQLLQICAGKIIYFHFQIPFGSFAETNKLTSFFPFQGKFIRINFDVAGYIVGANIETCILSQRGRSFEKTLSVRMWWYI